MDQHIEPIVDSRLKRYNVHPIEHSDVWLLYKQMTASFWTVEPSMSEAHQDVEQFRHGKLISVPEKQWLAKVLAFFAASDFIVLDNLFDYLSSTIVIPEARLALAMQAQQEAIHSEMYGALVLEYYKDDHKARDAAFKAIEQDTYVIAKANFAKKYMQPGTGIARRLVAFCAVEGIHFSSSFAAIRHFKHRNLLPALGTANEYIARDEQMHCQLGGALYKKLERPLAHSEVHEILREAVAVEEDFVNDAIPCDAMQMKPHDMVAHVHSCADIVCNLMGVPKLYNTQSPFTWMEQMGMENKTNFFENVTTSYQMPGVMSGIEGDAFKLSFNEEF